MPTSLRATLRTPSFKNGQSRAFSRRVSVANRGRGQPEGLPQTEARDAQRGGPPLESPCRVLSLVLSFASKESTAPLGAEAPPLKWAIKAFFRRVSAASRDRGQPRRGYRRPKPATRRGAGRLWSRRAASFLWYFLSLRKKVLPLSGRQPHRPRRSRRIKPPAGAHIQQS